MNKKSSLRESIVTLLEAKNINLNDYKDKMEDHELGSLKMSLYHNEEDISFKKFNRILDIIGYDCILQFKPSYTSLKDMSVEEGIKEIVDSLNESIGLKQGLSTKDPIDIKKDSVEVEKLLLSIVNARAELDTKFSIKIPNNESCLTILETALRYMFSNWDGDPKNHPVVLDAIDGNLNSNETFAHSSQFYKILKNIAHNLNDNYKIMIYPEVRIYDIVYSCIKHIMIVFNETNIENITSIRYIIETTKNVTPIHKNNKQEGEITNE